MPEAQSRGFYIVRQLQVARKLSTKVAGNHLLLSVTGGSERCRSGSEISGARFYQRQSAERRRRGVEGCRIRDELRSLHATRFCTEGRGLSGCSWCEFIISAKETGRQDNTRQAAESSAGSSWDDGVDPV